MTAYAFWNNKGGGWIKDLILALRQRSGNRDTIFIIV